MTAIERFLALPSPLAGEGARRADEGDCDRLRSPLTPTLSPQGRGRKARSIWYFLIAGLLIFAVASPALAIDPLPFKNDAQRERFQHLTSQLRCMVCQNESLDASNADLAKDLRHQIFEMMQQGKTDQQIKQYLVARYSDFVLYDPPLKASTVALWFAPPALVLAGGIVVFVLLRKRAKPAAQIATNEAGDDW